MKKNINVFDYTPIKSVDLLLKTFEGNTKKETKQFRDRALKSQLKRKTTALLSPDLIQNLVQLKGQRISIIVKHDQKAYRLYLSLQDY